MPAPVAAFLPDRFRSAVPFYVEGRLDYPRRLIENVARWTSTSARDRVLDLGCGPGFLAIGFAELGCDVIGLDPDKAMLAAARELAAGRSIDCEFREGSSYDLGPAFGRLKLVTMGRSFHWMDRPVTLAALDGLVEEHGAIAFFNDHHPTCRENRWVEAFAEIRQRFGGQEELSNLRKGGEFERHEIVLLDSPFSHLENIGVTQRLPLTVDGVVTRALSFSGSSPERLGDRQPQFEAALRDAVAPFAEDGALTEIVAFSALIASRP